MSFGDISDLHNKEVPKFTPQHSPFKGKANSFSTELSNKADKYGSYNLSPTNPLEDISLDVTFKEVSPPSLSKYYK